MTLFGMQIIDCLTLMIWACQAALWLMVDTQIKSEYVSLLERLTQGPHEHVSHLYRFLFFLKVMALILCV